MAGFPAFADRESGAGQCRCAGIVKSDRSQHINALGQEHFFNCAVAVLNQVGSAFAFSGWTPADGDTETVLLGDILGANQIFDQVHTCLAHSQLGGSQIHHLEGKKWNREDHTGKNQ